VLGLGLGIGLGLGLGLAAYPNRHIQTYKSGSAIATGLGLRASCQHAAEKALGGVVAEIIDCVCVYIYYNGSAVRQEHSQT
jgi:hypothetical protein